MVIVEMALVDFVRNGISQIVLVESTASQNIPYFILIILKFSTI